MKIYVYTYLYILMYEKYFIGNVPKKHFKILESRNVL